MRFSEMSSREITLMREASFSLNADRRRGDFAQLAVNAEAHAEVVLVRLEVQVGRTHLERVEQHLLQEAHDRRVVDFGARPSRPRPAPPSFATSPKSKSLPAVRVVRVAAPAPAHHPDQLVVFGNHPVDAHLGRELDLLGRFVVARVGGGDDQPVVALGQRQHAVGLAQLGVEQVARQAHRVDRVKVHQRRGERSRHGVRQIGRRNHARAGQLGDEAAARGQGFAENIFGRLLRQFAGGNQRAAESGQCN